MPPGPLVAPEDDPHRLALDEAVAVAVRARLAAGARATPDADALALREMLKSLSPTDAVAVRAVLGRIDAASGTPLVVCGGTSQTLAADRFGLGSRPTAEPAEALAAVREGARAMIDLAPGAAWWGRLLAEPVLRVTAALPDDRRSLPRALMIEARDPGPTGDDRTFWATDSRLSVDRIVEALGAAGLAASPLIAAGGLKLFMLAGYVQPMDGRLSSAPGTLSGVIGAAPVF